MDANQDQFQEYAKQYGQVIAKAWADDDFKARLLANPGAVLQEEGMPVPTGIEIRAVENTPSLMYLTLPPKPSEELSDEQLNQVAGGGSVSTAGSAGSLGSLGSICGTISTAACAGTAGCSGTVG